MDFTTHGWSSLALAYASIQVPMAIELARGRAALHRYLTSPLLVAPLMVAAELGTELAMHVVSGFGVAENGLLHVALGMTTNVALGYAAGRVGTGRPPGAKTHQRGAMVMSDTAASLSRERPWWRGRDQEQERGPDRLSDDAMSAKARNVKHTRSDRTATQSITLAGTAIPLEDETKHFKLIGTTGTGKSTAIQEMMATALARGDRAVIADPDGGYLRQFYDPGRGDVVLNPFDERSLKWDLFGEIKNAYDVDQLARSLIPDNEGSDRSWRGYARTFFSAVTRQAHESGETDVGELYRLLVVEDASELRSLVKGTPAQPFLDEHNSRMFDSIRSVTSSAVGSLDYVAQQKTPSFSIREWVSKESPGVLFIPYKAGQIAALHSTISAWMRLAIFEAMNQEELSSPCDAKDPRRLWFVVDELDALGQIDGLKDALARLRKFGGRCVLGFQSIAQVSSTYGQGDAHTLVENCANTLILRCSASEGGGTARFASQLIGEREVLRTTVSRSRRYDEMLGSVSRSEHFNVEPAVLPSQIEQLPDLAGYLKHASNPNWHRVRLDAVRRWQERRPESESPRENGRHRGLDRGASVHE